MVKHKHSHAWIDRTLNDSIGLAEQYRDQLARVEERVATGLPPHQRLRRTADRMDATTRLTEVIAWALYQKSVAVGEIESDEARQQMPNLNRRGAPGGRDDFHSAEVSALLEEVDRLYARVARLDQMIRSEATLSE